MKNSIRIVFATALCALFTGTAAAAELNVAEDETLELTTDATYDGGSVKGRLILSHGMTLTLAQNIFDAAATVVLSNATISGFGSATEVPMANAFEVAAGTTNTFDNVKDYGGEWTDDGCNVTLSGALTGAGRLLLHSTGRGITVTGDASAFTGTLAFDMTETKRTWDWFKGRLGAGSLSNATVEVTGGTLLFNLTQAQFGHLYVRSGATFTCDRGWNNSNNIYLYGASRFDGNFTGNELDVHISSGATLTSAADIARVHCEEGGATFVCNGNVTNVYCTTGTTLMGSGTIGTLQTWDNAINVANGKDATLTIGARASGDSGTLTVTGIAEKRSGEKILSVNDASKYTVVLAEALEAARWKLRCEENAYILYRPGLLIVIR